MAHWEAGQVEATADEYLRGRALTCDELAALQFEHIVAFYQTDDQNREASNESSGRSEAA